MNSFIETPFNGNIIFTKAEQVLDTIEWLEKQEKTVPIEILTFSYKIDCFYSEETFGKLCRLLNQKFPSKTLIWDTDFNVEEHYIPTEKFIDYFKPSTAEIILHIEPKLEIINQICWYMPSVDTITFRYVLNCHIGWIESLYYKGISGISLYERSKIQKITIECSPLFIRSESRDCYPRHFSKFLASLYDKFSTKFSIVENPNSLVLTRIIDSSS